MTANPTGLGKRCKEPASRQEPEGEGGAPAGEAWRAGRLLRSESQGQSRCGYCGGAGSLKTLHGGYLLGTSTPPPRGSHGTTGRHRTLRGVLRVRTRSCWKGRWGCAPVPQGPFKVLGVFPWRGGGKCPWLLPQSCDGDAGVSECPAGATSAESHREAHQKEPKVPPHRTPDRAAQRGHGMSRPCHLKFPTGHPTAAKPTGGILIF